MNWLDGGLKNQLPYRGEHANHYTIDVVHLRGILGSYISTYNLMVFEINHLIMTSLSITTNVCCDRHWFLSVISICPTNETSPFGRPKILTWKVSFSLNHIYLKTCLYIGTVASWILCVHVPLLDLHFQGYIPWSDMCPWFEVRGNSRLFLKYCDIIYNCFTLSNDYCIFLISILFILIFQCNWYLSSLLQGHKSAVMQT